MADNANPNQEERPEDAARRFAKEVLRLEAENAALWVALEHQRECPYLTGDCERAESLYAAAKR